MLREIEGETGIVVADLEAGIGTVLRMLPGAADVVVVVADPSAKALDVAGRAVRVAANRDARVIAIANRVRGDEDLEVTRRALAGHELVVVPEDAAITEADRDGRAPIDVAPDAPAVSAVTGLAARLVGA